MTTPAQLAANRRNAERSTGPVTAAGKARSAQNATSHGLTAACVLLPGEDSEELDALRDASYNEWRPATVTEASLVEEIVGYTWRLRRVAVIEAGALLPALREHRDRSRRSTNGAPQAELNGFDVGEAFFVTDMRNHGFLTQHLVRYDARLALRRAKAIALLYLCQTRRERQPDDRLLPGPDEPGDGAELSNPIEATGSNTEEVPNEAISPESDLGSSSL